MLTWAVVLVKCTAHISIIYVAFNFCQLCTCHPSNLSLDYSYCHNKHTQSELLGIADNDL